MIQSMMIGHVIQIYTVEEMQPLVKYDMYLTKFTRWRHQVETFSALLALCAGNATVTGEFPTQNQWRGALVFSLICAWINPWINNREAGDLRRHRAHYYVIVMGKLTLSWGHG